MQKPNGVLDSLTRKKAQLEARIQALKAKEATQSRKDETRRKILIGSYVLEKHLKSNSFDKLLAELDQFLFKANDRLLFGLEPREESKQTAPQID